MQQVNVRLKDIERKRPNTDKHIMLLTPLRIRSCRRLQLGAASPAPPSALRLADRLRRLAVAIVITDCDHRLSQRTYKTLDVHVKNKIRIAFLLPFVRRSHHKVEPFDRSTSSIVALARAKFASLVRAMLPDRILSKLIRACAHYPSYALAHVEDADPTSNHFIRSRHQAKAGKADDLRALGARLRVKRCLNESTRLQIEH